MLLNEQNAFPEFHSGPLRAPAGPPIDVVSPQPHKGAPGTCVGSSG